MIRITGASGQLGKKFDQELEKAGAPWRLPVRVKKKIPAVKNAEVLEGNYNRPDSLKAAFKGIDRAFIIPS